MFGELVALESHRRALREQAIGTGVSDDVQTVANRTGTFVVCFAQTARTSMMAGREQTTSSWRGAADALRRRRGEGQSPLRQFRRSDNRRAPDSVRLYLREIGRIPLLSAADEVRLARAIEVGVLAEERLDAGEDDQLGGRAST